MLYVAAGAGCFFVDDIYVLLVMRALLGISVGLIMPLSTGLLAYYFPPEEQAWLMGLSAAMNQMGGKNSATTVMPLLSAALYLGQFVSPLVVIPLSHSLSGADLTAPYKVAILLCIVFLVQVFATRHFQSLPPAEKR
ncbi:MAG: hypothetical protein IJ891_07565 [Prevotella sp.]|nr:hypothetical protein [Prevotella sp.]